ncbi:hypothetical protein SRHO_G00066110 [Serrasalmus rhombeus]
MAALLARQHMLKEKHAIEEQEEQLRKKKEQLQLEADTAATVAKVNVLRIGSTVRSTTSRKSNGMESYFKTKDKTFEVLNADAETFVPQTLDDERAKEVKDLDLDCDILPVERALGVRWCVQSDAFKFYISIPDRPLTRRGILSTVSSFYDPLGFLAPVIFTAKKILQGLCQRGIGWDDTIPSIVAQEWKDWVGELSLLDNLSIRRCLKPPDFGETTTAQLHHFADASEKGYGAVTYLLLRNSCSHTHSSFIMGKSRVASFKISHYSLHGIDGSCGGSSHG